MHLEGREMELSLPLDTEENVNSLFPDAASRAKRKRLRGIQDVRPTGILNFVMPSLRTELPGVLEVLRR